MFYQQLSQEDFLWFIRAEEEQNDGKMQKKITGMKVEGNMFSLIIISFCLILHSSHPFLFHAFKDEVRLESVN